MRRESYETPGAPVWKLALKIFGCSLLAGVMCLFVSISVKMLSTALLENTVGYREYEIIRDESGAAVEQRLLETVYFDKNTTYDSQKVTATDDRDIAREMITEPKNDICAAVSVGVTAALQAAMLALLLGLPGYYVYREGDRDRNLTDHHGASPHPFKGLAIGLLAAIPSALVYALLPLGKAGFCAESVQGVYRLLNTPWLPIVNLIMPQETFPATAISFGQLAGLFLLLLPPPLCCAAAYAAGYHRLFAKKHPKKKRKAA